MPGLHGPTAASNQRETLRPCDLCSDGADDGPHCAGCKGAWSNLSPLWSTLGSGGWTQEVRDFSVPVQPVQPVQPKLELEEKNQFPMPNSHSCRGPSPPRTLNIRFCQKRMDALATLDRANNDGHFLRPTSPSALDEFRCRLGAPIVIGFHFSHQSKIGGCLVYRPLM